MGDLRNDCAILPYSKEAEALDALYTRLGTAGDLLELAEARGPRPGFPTIRPKKALQGPASDRVRAWQAEVESWMVAAHYWRR